jgi:hypothetical protein
VRSATGAPAWRAADGGGVRQANIVALQATNGNIDAAIDRLLGA